MRPVASPLRGGPLPRTFCAPRVRIANARAPVLGGPPPSPFGLLGTPGRMRTWPPDALARFPAAPLASALLPLWQSPAQVKPADPARLVRGCAFEPHPLRLEPAPAARRRRLVALAGHDK